MVALSIAASLCAFVVNPVPGRVRHGQLRMQMTSLPNVASPLGTNLIAVALADTPLSLLTDDPIYVPVFLAAGAVVVLLVKAAFELLLAPVLDGFKLKNSVSPEQYVAGKRIGKGSYGAVYVGFKNGEDDPSVVIKSIPYGVTTAFDDDFGGAELFMNQKLKLCGQSGCCAAFLGKASSGDTLSLIFKYEGDTTLEDALKKGFPENVEDIIGGGGGDAEKRAATVVRKISRQVFANLASMHSWNVVHRDVKGANLLLSERDRRYKFIDFGVACDLATLTNYRADLQPFDPAYCPPEAPPVDRRGAGGIKLSAGGAFDVFSAGLLVVQMCFPNTRGEQGIKRFKAALEEYDYDLKAWRASLEGVQAYEPGFKLLDTYGGWSMLQGCLRADPSARISASAAASSGFCRA